VRAGNNIAVTGTAPLSPEGKTVAKGDAADQARRCLEIIQSAIEELGGGKLSDVTRTRILLTRIEDWERVATVHGEFFRSISPANKIMHAFCQLHLGATSSVTCSSSFRSRACLPEPMALGAFAGLPPQSPLLAVLLSVGFDFFMEHCSC
jgi:enamine deaminase RidA (YjgF/YER057c/UK114 family)